MGMVLCKLLGTGVKGDAYYVNFPTWRMHSMDATSRLAIIEIPDKDTPENLPNPPFNAPWVKDGPVNAIRLVGNNAAQITERIRGRYREGFSQWDAGDEEGG